MAVQKQPYIGAEDRPEIEPDPDTPLTQLRVRDLAQILSRRSPKIHPKFEGHSPLKEFFDKPFPEVATASFGPTPDPWRPGPPGPFVPTPYPWQPGATPGTTEPDPDPWRPGLAAGGFNPDPTPWAPGGVLAILAQQAAALAAVVQRLENQVARLSERAGG